MGRDLVQRLLSLGLTEKEAKLLLTLLEVGPNPVSAVARKAGITRTTAYAALETLKEKGLVSVIEKAGVQQYAPVSAQDLGEYAEQQRDKAMEDYQLIKDILPDLKSLTGELVMAPKVKYYEGVEGIKNIFNDTLSVLQELPKAARIKYAYSSAPQVSDELRAFLDDYIQRRKKEGIWTRGIFPNTQSDQEYMKNAKKNLAQVRMMPLDIDFPYHSEVSIYGDRIAIMSLKTDRLHGVIVESPEIAATQRAIFELAWRGCA